MSDTKKTAPKAKGEAKAAPKGNDAAIAALDEIRLLAGQAQLYADHDRAGLLGRKIQELVDRVKASL